MTYVPAAAASGRLKVWSADVGSVAPKRDSTPSAVEPSNVIFPAVSPRSTAFAASAAEPNVVLPVATFVPVSVVEPIFVMVNVSVANVMSESSVSVPAPEANGTRVAVNVPEMLPPPPPPAVWPGFVVPTWNSGIQ
jgi:hypothetical protein